jgi:hypothetical protein
MRSDVGHWAAAIVRHLRVKPKTRSEKLQVSEGRAHLFRQM